MKRQQYLKSRKRHVHASPAAKRHNFQHSHGSKPVEDSGLAGDADPFDFHESDGDNPSPRKKVKTVTKVEVPDNERKPSTELVLPSIDKAKLLDPES